MQQSIIITGGAGYIGSHTAYYLAQNGYQPIVIDSFVHGQTFAPSWATVIRGDCADEQLLKKIFAQYHVAAVMHFAACIEVGESVKDPLKFYANNVAKTVTLLRAMRSFGIKKFIFSSSCAVYGVPQTLPLAETHAHNPISPYGKTKAMVESMLHDAAAAYDFRFVALRYFNAAGALASEGLGEQHKPETHIIPLLLDAAHTGKPCAIFGNDYATDDGTAIRDYLHVVDIANAHLAALDYLAAGNSSDCFNLGTGNGVSVKQMVRAIEEVCGTNVTTELKPRRAGDPPILVADPRRANAVLQWRPRCSDVESIVWSAWEFMRWKRVVGKKFGILASNG